MLLGGTALLLVTGLAEHTIVAGGDVNLGRDTHLSLDESAEERWLTPFAQEFGSADLAMVNLECVVSTRGRFWRKPESRPYFYRARPEMLDALTEIGVDLVAIGNNHAMDYGPDALVEEMELLEAAGIAWAGGGRNLVGASRPVYLRVGDVVIAVLGGDASVPAQRFFAAKADRAGLVHGNVKSDALLRQLRPAIAEARRHAHLVVFTPHWGANWTDNPDENIRRLAHGFVDAGVDLVLGHSSHQVHGVEVYRDKLVVYDMGSLLFDRVGQNRMSKSFLYRVAFDRAGPRRLELLPVRLGRNVTRRAEGPEATALAELFTRLTRELDPDLEVRAREDGWLEVPVPNPGEPRAIEEPADAVPVGRTRRLPDALRLRRPQGVFLPELPESLRDAAPVDLGGIEYLGALLPSEAPAHHDVVVELFLRAKRPPRKRRLVVISYAERTTGCRAGEGAEPGDWAVPVGRWKRGEIVRHRVALRSVAQCGAGTFDVQVELRAPGGRPSERVAKVGYFHVSESTRRRLRLVEPTIAFAAGRPMPVVAAPPSSRSSRSLAWIGAGAGLVVLGAGLWWLRRRRRGRGQSPPEPA